MMTSRAVAVSIVALTIRRAPFAPLAHCLEHGVTEAIVDGVLAGPAVEIRMRLQSARLAVVGPDRERP